MMHFLKLPNGNLVVPEPFDTNGVIGERMVEITPDDARYGGWQPFFGSEWEAVLDTNDWRAPRTTVAARATA
jgi:hypothetical protein